MSDEVRTADAAALASVIQQTDASGKQRRLEAPQSPSFKRTPYTNARGAPRRVQRREKQQRRGGFFANLFCCVSSQAEEKYAAGDAGGHPVGAAAPRTAKSDFVLPEQAPPIHGRKTLILDLDETLVHSSFRPVPNADYVIPVNIEGTVHHVYVIKRPCVDEFMERVGRLFEVIVYTASLAKYADPLLDQLDVHNVVHGRLFREHCTQYQGNFVKDLTRLGRPLSQTIIIDNSPASYMFQPENAIGCTSFIDNMHDRELLYIADFLETLVDVEDVTKFMHLWNAAATGSGEDLPQ